MFVDSLQLLIFKRTREHSLDYAAVKYWRLTRFVGQCRLHFWLSKHWSTWRLSSEEHYLINTYRESLQKTRITKNVWLWHLLNKLFSCECETCYWSNQLYTPKYAHKLYKITNYPYTQTLLHVPAINLHPQGDVST